MQKAKYVQGDEEADNYVLLHVISENKDGTLNLGDAEGTVLVSKCPKVPDGQKAKPGQAIVSKEEKESATSKGPKK